MLLFYTTFLFSHNFDTVKLLEFVKQRGIKKIFRQLVIHINKVTVALSLLGATFFTYEFTKFFIILSLHYRGVA